VKDLAPKLPTTSGLPIVLSGKNLSIVAVHPTFKKGEVRRETTIFPFPASNDLTGKDQVKSGNVALYENVFQQP
jgi:hypothetical protein